MRFANRRLGVVLVALLLLFSVGTGLVTAQEEAGEGGEAGEEGELLEVSGFAAVATLLMGSLILLASIES
jgi:cation:H+ antiporter